MSEYKPRRLLVTGGCGCIGSNFINYYNSRYPDALVINLDKMDYCASEDNIRGKANANYKLIIGNLNNTELVNHILREYEIDTVVHFAAQTHVDNSFGNSIQFTLDNCLGTHSLLECCRVFGKVDRFIHMSTDEVYGEVDIDHPGCTEKALFNPSNPYSASKVGAEMICHSYHASFKMPIIIVRANNVYGWNQFPEKLIPKFVKLLVDGKKCTIHGKGDTRRNFIHVEDVASAIDTIIGMGSINKVYNIGTSNEFSVMEIATRIIEIMKPGTEVASWLDFVEDRLFNDFRYAIDASQLKGLGWEEKVSFQEGLVETVSYYEDKFK